jgi:hypothetical protein
MNSVYTAVSIVVGVVALLTVVWRFGRWQAQQEDHLKSQDEAIARLHEELLEEIRKGRDD